MTKQKSKVFVGALAILFYLGLFAVFYFWSSPLLYLRELTSSGTFLAPLSFIFLAFLAVVIAPLTVIPLIPVAGALFGPFLAAVYTILGWFLGSLVDFWLAREFGRPVLEKFVSLKSIEKYENYIPKEMEFWWVFLLRMIIPVDLLSYALGLFSRISSWKYSLATFFSIMPFAFVISYAGSALLERNFTLFLVLAVFFIVALSVLSWIFYKKGGVREEIKEEIEEEKEEELAEKKYEKGN